VHRYFQFCIFSSIYLQFYMFNSMLSSRLETSGRLVPTITSISDFSESVGVLGLQL
jgi:hypothetical protein